MLVAVCQPVRIYPLCQNRKKCWCQARGIPMYFHYNSIHRYRNYRMHVLQWVSGTCYDKTNQNSFRWRSLRLKLHGMGIHGPWHAKACFPGNRAEYMFSPNVEDVIKTVTRMMQWWLYGSCDKVPLINSVLTVPLLCQGILSLSFSKPSFMLRDCRWSAEKMASGGAIRLGELLDAWSII